MGFVAGSGEATIVGVTALDNGSTQIDISIRGTIPNGITELLENGVSENLINNWLGFDYRLGRVDKRGSPLRSGMIQAGICSGDQRGTRPYVGRGMGIL